MHALRSAAFAATGLALSLQTVVHAGGVSISSYGQRALLIQGGGQSVLLNPYKAVGCAAGDTMTVNQLIDIVAFLQPHYRKVVPDDDVYYGT